MSSQLRSIEDVSARLRMPGTGMCTLRLYLCGHKHRKGIKRGSVLWKCADCAKGKP